MAVQAKQEAIYQRAQKAWEAGDRRAAESLLRYLLRQDPKDTRAQAMLSRLQSGWDPLSGEPNRPEYGLGRLGPRWGFRSLSMIGAMVLLFLLVITLVLPEGTIWASKENVALPSVAEGPKLDSVPSARLDAVASTLERGPVTLSEQAFMLSAMDGPTGVVMAQTEEASAEPPVPSQGGTCVSGFIIDRYHQARGSGWTVQITPESGETQTLAADSKGQFKFDKLAGGTWTVDLQVPDGWQPFTLASFPVTLSGSGDKCAEVRFKVEALPCLVVIKLDASGKVKFKQKVGIPGWSMTATQGNVTRTEVTDGEGKCYFYNLAPGTWTVREEFQVGWRPAAGYEFEKKIELQSPRQPGTCASLTFVNEQVRDGCIQVQKLDAAGKPLKGWKITIKRDDGTQPSVSKLTNASGYATFGGLALGTWTVQEEVKDWWRPVGSSEQKVNLKEPGRCELVTFKNEALGCVDGYKINLLEQGLAGWTIKARNAQTGEEFTTSTDKGGYFRFKNLALGTWTISEVMQTGWEAVTPSEFEIKVDKPFVCEHVRFKNKTQFACVDVYKKDYSDNSGLPGWEITVKPAYGGQALVGQTDGTGWVRFNGLTPGTYVISEKMQAGWIAVTPQSQKVTLKATGSCHVITFKNRQKTAPPPDPPITGCRARYKVKRCDTLYSIAVRYGTTVSRLARANRIANPNYIYVGQVLCIP